MWWPTSKWELVKTFWEMFWSRDDPRTSFAHYNPPPTTRRPTKRIPDGLHFTIVPSPRPENDRHGFEDATEFMECDACRAKPGSPVLCSGCLNNRAAIHNLTPK